MFDITLIYCVAIGLVVAALEIYCAHTFVSKPVTLKQYLKSNLTEVVCSFMFWGSVWYNVGFTTALVAYVITTIISVSATCAYLRYKKSSVTEFFTPKFI